MLTKPGEDCAAVAVQAVEGFRTANAVPGVAIGVFTDDGVLFQAGFGVASVQPPRQRMTERTLFYLSSLTKMLTGTVTLALADQGRLHLDEPVLAYLPSAQPASRRFGAVTLRSLLSHTSGLGPAPGGATAKLRDPGGLAAYVEEYGLNPTWVAEPGSVYSYSNLGLSITGYVIERVTGKTFESVVRQLLFEPTGMTSSYDPLVAMTYPVSQQHASTRAGRCAVVHHYLYGTSMHPYATAFASVADLALFGMCHLREQGQLREMRRPHADIGLDIDMKYGLTAYLGPRYDGQLAYGHEGYSPGQWCKLVLIPERRLGLAWCDNRGGDPRIANERQRAIDHIFAELGAGRPSWRRADQEEPSVPETRALVGSYRRPAGRPVVVSETDGVLTIGDRTGVSIALGHDWGSTFSAATGAGAAVPDRAPWSPHARSERCSATFVGSGSEGYAYLLLNGIAYRRELDRP